MKSFDEYVAKINKIFENPKQIIFDVNKNEYYYIVGEDLLRIKPNGDFISLYPGADSTRVITAIENGGLIWAQ